jgi:hypothetical protein
MRTLIKEHSAPIAALLISVIATGYACFDRTVSKELFILYGVATTGLYGYSQQSQITQDRSEGSGTKDDL